MEEFVLIERLFLDPPRGGKLYFRKKGKSKDHYLKDTSLLDMDDIIWLANFGIETVNELLNLDKENPNYKELERTKRFDFQKLIKDTQKFVERSRKENELIIDSYVCMSTFSEDDMIVISILCAPILISISGEKSNEQKLVKAVLNTMTRIKPEYLFATHNEKNFVDSMIKNSLTNIRPEWINYEILKRDFQNSGGYLPLSMTNIEDISRNSVLMLYYMLNK